MCRQLNGSLRKIKFLDSIFLAYRISKSILLNIGMLILGFILGFGYFTSKDHWTILEDNREKSIEIIKSCLDKHIELDKKMRKEFDKLLLFKENIQK